MWWNWKLYVMSYKYVTKHLHVPMLRKLGVYMRSSIHAGFHSVQATISYDYLAQVTTYC